MSVSVGNLLKKPSLVDLMFSDVNFSKNLMVFEELSQASLPLLITQERLGLATLKLDFAV